MPELINVEPLSPEWHAVRRQGITATDITAILGISPWDSAYALYHRKLGITEDVPDSDRFRLGRELEPIVERRWVEANQVPVAHQAGAKSNLWRSSDRPWQMATLDRVYYDEPVELKTSATRDGWGDTGTDHIPPHVRAQLLWQMDVMGVSTGHVGCLFLPSGEFRHYTVQHEHTQWQDPTTGLASGIGALDCRVCDDIEMMRKAGFEFYQRLDENRPPSVDESAATTATLKQLHRDPAKDKHADITPELWDAYQRASYEIKLTENARRHIENTIREQIGEAGVITVDGQVVAWRRRYTVKAHTRKAGTRDMIIRANAKGDTDGD